MRECLKVLLDYKAKVDLQDINGIAPLHMVAFSGQNYALTALLEHGAQVNLKSATK
jgi:ankyrin repeat protein